jgi:DNA repair ATPase RecN
LGVCLRLDYALKVLVYEAENTKLLSLTASTVGDPRIITLDEIVFGQETQMEEAWNNLDRFPRRLAQHISDVRADLYDFKTLQQINKGIDFTIRKYHKDPPEITRMKDYLTHIAQNARAAREPLQQLILTLEQ